MIRSTLVALACALSLSSPEPRTWRGVLDESDVVVLAEVLEMRRMPDDEGHARVAVTRVDRVLLGPADMERALVVKEPGAERLEPGTRSLLFLRRAGALPEADGDLPEGEPLWTLASAGRWSASNGRVTVPDALELLTEVGYERALPQEALLEWLERMIVSMTPSIEAWHSTTGPFPWHVRIAPDGSWTANGDEKGVLAPNAVAALLEALAEESFTTLPREIGKCWSPCCGSQHIEVLTRAGRERVRLHESDDRDDAATNAQRARFGAVWSLLPGNDKPPRL